MKELETIYNQTLEGFNSGEKVLNLSDNEKKLISETLRAAAGNTKEG